MKSHIVCVPAFLHVFRLWRAFCPVVQPISNVSEKKRNYFMKSTFILYLHLCNVTLRALFFVLGFFLKQRLVSHNGSHCLWKMIFVIMISNIFLNYVHLYLRWNMQMEKKRIKSRTWKIGRKFSSLLRSRHCWCT